MATISEIKESLGDSENVIVVQQNDNPSLKITTTLVNSKNYMQWSRATQKFISSKGKWSCVAMVSAYCE